MLLKISYFTSLTVSYLLLIDWRSTPRVCLLSYAGFVNRNKISVSIRYRCKKPTVNARLSVHCRIKGHLFCNFLTRPISKKSFYKRPPAQLSAHGRFFEYNSNAMSKWLLLSHRWRENLTLNNCAQAHDIYKCYIYIFWFYILRPSEFLKKKAYTQKWDFL